MAGKLKKGIIICCILAVVCFFAALIWLVIREKQFGTPAGDCNYILILGAQVKEDGTLSRQLEDRLRTGYAYWLDHPGCVVIVSGGRGKNEPVPEADAMADWLAAQGVPEEKIIRESRSSDTKENIRNSLEWIDAENGKVLVVTSDYHVPRAVRIAKDAGLNADGAGAPTLPEYWIKNHFREVLAWGKYYLKKLF